MVADVSYSSIILGIGNLGVLSLRSWMFLLLGWLALALFGVGGLLNLGVAIHYTGWLLYSFVFHWGVSSLWF